MQVSPILIIDRTFTDIFFFTPKHPTKKKSQHYYQNPIYVAKEYKRMIESGEAKNQRALAKKLGISRACVSQVLAILKLDEKLISAIEQLGKPMHGKVVSIRFLSEYLINPERYTKELLTSLLNNPC